MKKIAIIGSGEFQLPLIRLAKMQGIETHVFSWGGNELIGDYFYKISITEKKTILDKCKIIGIDGICSIGSDLANITVNYIADHLGLVGNSLECTEYTTNKYRMRQRLVKNKIPVPHFTFLNNIESVSIPVYPVIVKPVDRSGSRGISLVDSVNDLSTAIKLAFEESFSKEILIEEFVTGREFSVESISFNGVHEILQITEKFTTGSPDFIERGHTCPARITAGEQSLINDLVYRTLVAVNMSNGAAHTELKINENGDAYIIEIGSRMGGDYIGSDLVLHSTGFDFTKAVLAISMGESFNLNDYYLEKLNSRVSIVKFIFNENDLNRSRRLFDDNFINVVHSNLMSSSFDSEIKIASSADRLGHILITANLNRQNEILQALGF
ncbi:ATP-grasp domain-containing protein [Shewanella sp. NKUCC05_KAH]|uniref:ATP-grasp domain-containing protein n=1 Tax=Shewanella sp. NKUCC05_KAH TaxID=2842126 RepID=UPI001C5A63F3|nr:ATP-grasp domain-containing protein [Shewanella sp. NKUCC05_KAH]MBW3526229.1 ATP-grasp domain-containing protein [Shewanella sp. NKUCC05_KAH]